MPVGVSAIGFSARQGRLALSLNSFEPVLQRSVRPLTKFSLKAALAEQPDQIAGARSGYDKPGRPDLAVLDDFGTLQDKGAGFSSQGPAKPLQADHAGGMIVALDLQR